MGITIGETLAGKKTYSFYGLPQLVTLYTDPMCALADRVVEDVCSPMC